MADDAAKRLADGPEVSAMVDLTRAKTQVAVSAKTATVIDEALGSLIDELA